MDDRERAARLELVEFQLGELQKAACSAGEDEELAADRQILRSADTHPAPVPGKLRRAVRHRARGARRGSEHVWKRVGELATIDPRFAPYLEAAGRHQGPARGPGVHAARLRRRHRRLAGAAAAGGGPAGAARAAEAQARAARSADVIARRDALAAEHAALTGGSPALAEIEQAAGATPAERSCDAARGCRLAPASSRRRVLPSSIEAELADLAMATDAVRGAARPPARRRRSGPSAASTRGSSSCPPISAKSSGRWRASSRAASCRASCWR